MKVENSPEIQSDAQEDKRRYESKAGEHLFVDWLEEETLNLEARRESASRHDDEVFASMRGVRSVYRKVVFLVALLVPLVLLGLLFALIHCDRLSALGEWAQAVLVFGTFSSFIVIYAFLLVAVFSRAQASNDEGRKDDFSALKSAMVEAAKTIAAKSGS